MPIPWGMYLEGSLWNKGNLLQQGNEVDVLETSAEDCSHREAGNKPRRITASKYVWQEACCILQYTRRCAGQYRFLAEYLGVSWVCM